MVHQGDQIGGITARHLLHRVEHVVDAMIGKATEALGGSYELNRVRFEDRGQEFTSHIGRVRSDLTFTTRTSASAFAQYNSAGDVVVLNVRFRYNPSEGTDLYIVWNESLNSDRYAVDPDKPLSQERTLLLKYARTFTLGF